MHFAVAVCSPKYHLRDRPPGGTFADERARMSVQERDPCPHRIFDDIGGAFAMGAIGGGVWNSVKGARNSPRGERLLGSVTAVKARAPVMGGAPRPLRSRHALRLLRSRAYPNQTREPA
jgi:hypothetical protein